MKDTPQTLAADMIADVGKVEALAYLLPLIAGASSWREARAGLAIILAVLRA